MQATMKATELAKTLAAGDTLDYETVNNLGDMAADELALALRARGLRLSREDSDCIWVEAVPYRMRDTTSGYAVIRADGSYAEFLSRGEASEAQMRLENGTADESDYDWQSV